MRNVVRARGRGIRACAGFVTLLLVATLAACRPSSTPGDFNGGAVAVLGQVPVTPSASWVLRMQAAPDGSAWTLLEARRHPAANVEDVISRFVVHHLADGSLDPAFGVAGALEVANTTEDIEVTPDGSVLLVSTPLRPGSAFPVTDLAVDRLAADETLTPVVRYGPVSAEQNPFLSDYSWTIDTAIDALGRVAVRIGFVSRLLYVFRPDGTLDPSVNGGAPLSLGASVPPGAPSLAGAGEWIVAAANGHLRWFGPEGTASTALPSSPTSVSTDGAGRVIAGWPTSLSAFLPGGTLDTSWGTGGSVSIPGGDQARGAVPVGGGRIAVLTGPSPDLGMVVFDAQGVLDPAWAGDGRLELSGDATSTPPFAQWTTQFGGSSAAGRLAARVSLATEPGNTLGRVAMFDGTTGALVSADPGAYPAPDLTSPALVDDVVADEAGFLVVEWWMNRRGHVTATAGRRVLDDGSLDSAFVHGDPFATGTPADQLVDGRPTGYIVVVRSIFNSVTQPDLVALGPDGTTDGSWGPNGDGWLRLAGMTSPVGMTVTSDGGVVVASVAVGSGNRIRRVSPAGLVTAERALPALPAGGPSGEDSRPKVAVDAAGRTLLAARVCQPTCATTVWRFLPDLSDDMSFGTGGRVVIPDAGDPAVKLERIDALATRGDGSIIVAGWADGTFRTAHLTDSGALDPSFGDGGVARATALAVSAATVDAQGRVVAAGTDRAAPRSRAGVARFTVDGSPDTSFANGGIRWFPASEAEIWRALDIAPDGRIAVAGERAPGETVAVALRGGEAPT
jgi:uncharacterized delta-60 repeat protein